MQKEAIGVSDMVVWAARKPFIDAHRAALVDFFEDTLRIVHWYVDPKNHEASMEIVADTDQAAAADLRLAVHQARLSITTRI